MAFTPGGSLLAASVSYWYRRSEILVWDTAAGTPVHRFPIRAKALSVSPDGSSLAAGDASGRISVWSLSSGDQLAAWNVGQVTIQSLEFTPDTISNASDAINGGLTLTRNAA